MNSMKTKDNFRLTGDEATKFAEALSVLPKFSEHPGAIPAVAEALYQLIEAQEFAGEWWSAKRQAQWLVDSIIWTWGVWRGPVAMRDLYTMRFKLSKHLQELLDPKPQQTLPREPSVFCENCQDAGTVQSDGKFIWCDCQQGELLRVEAPRYLEILNRHSPAVGSSTLARVPQKDPENETRRKIRRQIEEIEAERHKNREAQQVGQNGKETIQ